MKSLLLHVGPVFLCLLLLLSRFKPLLFEEGGELHLLLCQLLLKSLPALVLFQELLLLEPLPLMTDLKLQAGL